jgi:drug/metabolite transporter (DMT)-like permease
LYRVLIAALVLVPWRLARGAERDTNGRAVALALAAGGFFAIDLALFNTAVLRTSAATASLLGNNAPVFVGLMTWGLFGRRPRVSFWVGLALAMTGCAAIVAADGWHGGGDVTGDLLAVSAALFFAGYMLTAEVVRTEMDTLTFSSLAAVGSTATLFVICLLLDFPLTGFSGRTWAALAALGLVSQLTAYFALVYALGHLPATRTSVGLLAQAPLTALLAIPTLGEPLSWTLVGGGTLVLAGIYVVNRPQSS